MFHQNNPLSRFYKEVINQGRLKIFDKIYADNYVNHIAPFGLDKSADGVKKLINEQIKAFPDWHVTVNYWIQKEKKHIV